MVQAHVVPLALELSTTLLVLYPISFTLAKSEYKSSVTIRNQRNHAAEFSWRTVVTGNGNPFTVQPTTGTEYAAQFCVYYLTFHCLGCCFEIHNILFRIPS